MPCSRRVILNLARKNIVSGCQRQGSTAHEMRKLLKGVLDPLSLGGMSRQDIFWEGMSQSNSDFGFIPEVLR